MYKAINLIFLVLLSCSNSNLIQEKGIKSVIWIERNDSINLHKSIKEEEYNERGLLIKERELLTDPYSKFNIYKVSEYDSIANLTNIKYLHSAREAMNAESKLFYDSKGNIIKSVTFPISGNESSDTIVLNYKNKLNKDNLATHSTVSLASNDSIVFFLEKVYNKRNKIKKYTKYNNNNEIIEERNYKYKGENLIEYTIFFPAINSEKQFIYFYDNNGNLKEQEKYIDGVLVEKRIFSYKDGIKDKAKVLYPAKNITSEIKFKYLYW